MSDLASKQRCYMIPVGPEHHIEELLVELLRQHHYTYWVNDVAMETMHGITRPAYTLPPQSSAVETLDEMRTERDTWRARFTEIARAYQEMATTTCSDREKKLEGMLRELLDYWDSDGGSLEEVLQKARRTLDTLAERGDLTPPPTHPQG